MTKVQEICKLFPSSWSISSKDKGGVSEFQDLGEQLGLNLRRVNKGTKSGHVSREFGFKTMFTDIASNQNIVEGNVGTVVKFTAAGRTLKGEIDQISIHRAGAHARIVVNGASITGL